MHPSRLSRRRFLTLTGAAAAAPLLARFGASACPVLDDPEEMLGMKALARGINRFGGELNNRLTKDEPGSLFFSPFSIETALAMTAAGARGRTLEEMGRVLHLPPNNPHELFGELLNHLNSAGRDRLRPYELSTANAIWAQQRLPLGQGVHRAHPQALRRGTGRGGLRPVRGRPQADQRLGGEGDQRQDQGPDRARRHHGTHANGPGQRHLLQGELAVPVRQDVHPRRRVHSTRRLEGRLCRSCTRPASSATASSTCSSSARANPCRCSSCPIPAANCRCSSTSRPTPRGPNGWPSGSWMGSSTRRPS